MLPYGERENDERAREKERERERGGGMGEKGRHIQLLLVIFMNPLNILHCHIKELVRNFNRWT